MLWASSDITVEGRDVSDLNLQLQPGMTVTRPHDLRSGSTQTPPTDLSRSRVTLTPLGQQAMDIGPVPQPQVDATGNFTVTGVAPGRYALRGNVVAAPRAGSDGAAAAGGRRQRGRWRAAGVAAPAGGRRRRAPEAGR